MGDHLALLVDHLLTESTLEAAIGNGKQAQIAADSASSVGRRTPSEKLVECRICQEDDHDSNMEIPCSCCGSLKYAHRVCIQRWCNEKGNTMCEICLQQFKPGYTTLPKVFHYGRAPMNFRSWDISRQEFHDPQILTVVPSGVTESNYYDQLVSRLRSTICCRSVTIIFMILLVLRHTLPLLISGAEQYSFTLFALLVLRTAGIFIPIFFVAGTLTTFHHSRRRQVLVCLCGYRYALEPHRAIFFHFSFNQERAQILLNNIAGNSANFICLFISSREYVNEVLPFTFSLSHISSKPTGSKQFVELVTNYVKLLSRKCHNEGNI
ncbi:hypothetical protein BHE74_00043559 [Ensete ventricosum]|nr:hypothetical protein BHE74_00043559 [Ensete ventricosum]